MREHAYATRKTFHTHTESTADEVHRIWTRWTNANVSACRYCGAPLILHNAGDCADTRARIANEEACHGMD